MLQTTAFVIVRCLGTKLTHTSQVHDLLLLCADRTVRGWRASDWAGALYIPAVLGVQ